MWIINATACTGNNNMEYKLHDPVQGIIMGIVNSTACTGNNNVEHKLFGLYR